jgi:hypothetical protein
MAGVSPERKRRAMATVKKRIIPVSEATPYVRALFYGRNGKGKTRLAASGPKTLIIDVNEEGTKSVRNYKDAYVYFVKKFEQLDWVYWYLKEGKHEYETVVIDTLTQAQKLAMKFVLGEAEDRDPNRPTGLPDRRAWGQMTELMRPVIFNYRNLPMHVVFVCQERIDRGSDEEEESGEVRPRIVPDLSPGLRADAMGAVEIMGRVYRRPVRRGKGKKETIVWQTRMLVGDHEDYETKDRTGQLGEVVRNPTMQMMIEASKHLPEEGDE